MSKSPLVFALLAAASLALPATAGAWPNVFTRNAPASASQTGGEATFTRLSDRSPAGFVYSGGESGWSLAQQRYDFGKDGVSAASAPAAKSIAASPASAPNGGFEYLGGDGGWQIASHKLVLVGGHLVHSSECDHAMRTVAAPTPEDIEYSATFSPGA